jgi:hypothetical protein
MKTCLFDIETGSLPEAYIAHLCPEFKPPANYKDPAKIAENLEEQRKTWLDRGLIEEIEYWSEAQRKDRKGVKANGRVGEQN